MDFIKSFLDDVFAIVRNNKYGLIKIFFILVPSLMLASNFVNSEQYNCSDSEHCILFLSGKFLGAYIIVSFLLFFYDSVRKKVFEWLKIYVAAIFVLYSGIYYLDFQERTIDLNAKKDFIDYQFKIHELQEKKTNSNTIEVLKNNLEYYHESFHAYEQLLSEYKVIIGQTIILLTIGLFAFITLELLQFFRQKNDDQVVNKKE